MTDREKYNQIFLDVFGANEDRRRSISFKGVPEWDSVGHMGLIARLEDEFNILIDAEDIFDFVNYDVGEEILKRYGVNL